MAGESIFNLQDTFLNYVRKNKLSVSIFLSNGVKIQGILVSFDSFSLMIKKDSTYQFVYKHAISTIIPYGKFSMMNLAPGGGNRDQQNQSYESQGHDNSTSEEDIVDSYPSGNSIEDIINSNSDEK